jgi:hypothetical protein
MRTETITYKVSVFNETATNEIALETSSILAVDLKVNELKNEGKHGLVLVKKTIENKEIGYKKETVEVMNGKNF